MDVTNLLAKLDGVKGRNGSWVARCPAHEDRTPSLAVKELGDGRILLHCFGGCGTDAILGVIGLEMGDLFPEPLGQHMRPARHFSAADALRCLAHDSSVVAIATADMASGRVVSEQDAHDIAASAGRIAVALEFTCGS